MRLLVALTLTSCMHARPPIYGIPYGSVYCSHPCMPAPSAFLAALEHAQMNVTLADCCKETR